MSAGKGYNDLFIFYLNITFGLICFQTNGLSDYRAFGLLGFRTIGLSEKWAVTTFVHIYRLNCSKRINLLRMVRWVRYDTDPQTQDAKFKPWRCEAKHATSGSRRFPTLLTFTSEWGKKHFCFLQTAKTGKRNPNSSVKGSCTNHYPRAPAHIIILYAALYWRL